MKSKPVKPKWARIIWADHADSRETWQEATEPGELQPAFVDSCGWIISENEEVLEMAGDRPMKRTPKGRYVFDAEGTWGRVTHIVKAAIVWRSDVKVEPPRQEGS